MLANDSECLVKDISDYFFYLLSTQSKDTEIIMIDNTNKCGELPLYIFLRISYVRQLINYRNIFNRNSSSDKIIDGLIM